MSMEIVVRLGLHEADAEHGHDVDLLLQRHVQFSKQRQGKAQDHQVQTDLDAAADEAKQVHVNFAVGNHLALPAILEVIYGPD